MQSSFHGVTKIEVYEYMVEPAHDEYSPFKIVKIEITDRQGTHEVACFMDKKKLSVRKTSDSLVDRIIEVVPNG